MLTFAAMLGLFATADVPVVGRPPDFSGAVGGPFEVTMQINPEEVTVEQTFRLTLSIRGIGNLMELDRLASDKINSFADFHVAEAGTGFADDTPPRRWFRYTLRMRRPEVREVPAFRFVYFNPKVRAVNAGFQTAVADAVPLRVKPATTPAVIPEFILREWETDDPERTWLREPEPLERIQTVALLLPVAVCGIWYAIRWRFCPAAARRASIRRSRAATIALRQLGSPATVGSTLVAYLQSRCGLPASAATPTEVDAQLALADDGELTERTIALLRRSDEWRFSGEQHGGEILVGDTRRLILDWEAVN